MNFTKRITKFLLIAALAIPAWTSLSAQNRAVPTKVPDRVKLESESRHKNQPRIIRDAAQAPQNETVSNEPQIVIEPQQTVNSGKRVARMASRAGGNAPMLKAPLRADAVTVTPPASATIEAWDISTTWTYYDGSAWSQSDYNTTSVQVAFDGNDVYIQGLCYWIPSAWVKGTLNAAQTQATFPKNQYYGILEQDGEELPTWFVGLSTSDYSIIDVVFAYDKTNHKLTLDSNTIIFDASDADSDYGSSYHSSTVISKPVPSAVVADGDATNAYLPVYGYYFENTVGRYQMIYPAGMLSELEGRKIKTITFHTANTAGITFGNPSGTYGTGDLMLTLGTTNDDNYGNSATLKENLSNTATSTITPTYGADHMTFTFDEPYEYVTGTNLIMQTQVTEAGQYASGTTFYGIETSQNQAYYKYSSTGTATVVKFLPKVTFTFDEATAVETDELDFGSVNVGSSKTLSATINNPSDETVTATITTAAPFSVASTTVSLPSGISSVRVTFTPANSISYSGNLAVNMNGTVKNIRLKGVGNMSGPEALRDSAFFAGITYNWTDSLGRPQTSRLDEIATEPAQIIAMMKEIYTNKEIPGNLKRGFSSTGADEVGNLVNYPGVGTISHTGSSYSTGYAYEDGYGWGITGNLETPVTNKSFRYYGNSSYPTTLYADYCYMDSLQYQPNYDGVTLLLVEMVDTFSYANVTAKVAALPSTATDYQKLFTQMKYTVKSARIVTQAKRTGTDLDKGTLFKIDCDKMNKFFFLAKGQVRRLLNSWDAIGEQTTSTAFRANPSYFRIKQYTNSTSSLLEEFVDADTGDPFYHMFEQFSPVSVSSGAGQDDVYQSLVNMQSFGVQHDCMGISHMNHQFMMYGEDSEAADCQDVRDLMFFVPDYRMMNFGDINNYVNDSTNRDRGYFLRYLNYNRSHQPTMGLYVIRQDSITTTTEADDYYMLDLHWRTNLDDFLPSDQQEFQLYEVVTDENGQTQYVPVYYMNAQGQYTDADGNVVDEANKVPIILIMEAGVIKNYPYVYVERESSSKQVTYAIQGRDAADAEGNHFLNLQMSNQMSYIIPGTDPNEMLAVQDATHYSRFNPETVKNCYSNKIQITNNAMGINNSQVTDGNTKLYVTRSFVTRVNNYPVTVTDTVATINFNNHSSSSRSITVTMDKQSPKSEYPNGKSYGVGAGYHANKGETSWTQSYKISTNSSNRNNVIFDPALTIFDNFTVDVSQNDHPIGYTYQIVTNYAGQDNETVYSNMYRVPVYKTGSQINGSFTKEEVDNDDDIGLSLADNVEFGTQVQYSSKTEILRYDAYRWDAKELRFIVDSIYTDGSELDLPPTGIAGNQGGSYTVSMNVVGTDDYTTSTVSVGNGQTAWANFVDPIPLNANEAKAYTYAPVVELFTTGKDENNKTRTDYNTYGGPLQNTAAGLLDVSVVEPSAQVPLMSNFDWTKDGKKYAYYQIFLNVNTAQVPQGYSLYGIRAWRHVSQDLLGEHPLYPRPDRVPTDDEDIMFEKILNGYNADDYFILGSAPAEYSDLQNGEVRATFGARKLRTKGGEETGVIDNLEAEFTVRLYFTPAPIYVYANPGGNDIDCNNAVATLYSDDGKTYTGTVTIPDKGDGTGYFVFSKKVGSSWSSNNQNIFGAQWNDAVALVGPQSSNNIWDFNLRYWSGDTRSFKITPGTYKFEITNHIQSRDLSSTADWSAGNLKITPVTANAGLRDGAAGATGKFYVAEQELNFSIDSSSEIITGIFDIDGAKQVAGVKYYNVAGIESDKPFDGINIVVTRYSDGSVVTRKEVK